MKLKQTKQILLPLLTLTMLFSFPVSASEVTTDSPLTDLILNENEAETSGEQILPLEEELEQIKVTQTGSITVTLTDGKEGTSKEGIVFHCIKVADIINGEYVLTKDFTQAEIDINTLKNSDALSEAADALSKFEADGLEMTTDSNGILAFQDLKVGVYLLKATDLETFDTITPTLIAIPTWNESESDMQYDINVYPKHSPKPDETKNTVPQTGIEDDTILYLGIGASTLLLAIAFLRIDKKRKQNLEKSEEKNE